MHPPAKKGEAPTLYTGAHTTEHKVLIKIRGNLLEYNHWTTNHWTGLDWTGIQKFVSMHCGMQFPLSNYLDFLELPCSRDAFQL